METANDISYMMIHDSMVYDDDVDIIDVPVGDVDVYGLGDVGDLGDVGIVGGLEDETREKREKCEKENDKSKLVIKTQFKEIEMSINTSTCDEVIFKKHVVEIIDKGTRGCVMDGVVVRYEFEGRAWDPDIVLVFEDGRRFCNENFGYMFRFYL
jgi:hypothetical protein